MSARPEDPPLEGFPVCTQCGFTFGEYRARGLLGCPHCYEAFGDALEADLLWLHPALEPAGPGPDAPGSPGDSDPENPALLRRNLAAAIKAENYGEAARIRLLLRGADGQGGNGGRPGLG